MKSKQQPFSWDYWRANLSNPWAGGNAGPSTHDVCGVLDARDAALKALRDILDLCARPTKPYGKRVNELAKTAIKAATE